MRAIYAFYSFKPSAIFFTLIAAIVLQGLKFFSSDFVGLFGHFNKMSNWLASFNFNMRLSISGHSWSWATLIITYYFVCVCVCVTHSPAVFQQWIFPILDRRPLSECAVFCVCMCAHDVPIVGQSKKRKITHILMLLTYTKLLLSLVRPVLDSLPAIKGPFQMKLWYGIYELVSSGFDFFRLFMVTPFVAFFLCASLLQIGVRSIFHFAHFTTWAIFL